MAAQIAEGAGAGQSADMPPCDRNGGIQQHILIIGCVDTHDASQFSALNEVVDILVGGIHDIGETAVVDQALCLRQIGEFPGLLCGKREGLLTEDVLAVLQCVLDHLVVHGIGGRDIDQIHIRIRGDCLPVICIATVAVGFCEFGGELLIDVGDHFKYRKLVAEDHTRVVEGGRVRPSHPAAADQADSDFFSAVSHCLTSS